MEKKPSFFNPMRFVVEDRGEKSGKIRLCSLNFHFLFTALLSLSLSLSKKREVFASSPFLFFSLRNEEE